MKKFFFFFCMIGGVLISSSLTALEARKISRGAVIATDEYSLRIRDGIVEDFREKGRSGKVWSDRNRRDLRIPAGLGILEDLSDFQKLHLRNGWFSNGRALAPGFPLNNYFRPTAESVFRLKAARSQAVLTWTGLSNGSRTLPDAFLTITVRRGAGGELRLQSRGGWKGGNVFAVLTSVANLERASDPYLPVYGGRIIRDGRPGMMSLHNKNEDMEAPLMILEDSRGSSLGFWIEDPAIRGYQAFFNRTDKSYSMIFEHLNLMHFGDKTGAESPEVCLGSCRGDWKNAAVPFRNWFRRSFADDLAVRDGIAWTRKIGAVFNTDFYSENTLKKIRRFCPAGTVLMMTWNARKPSWDRELPDWTPRPGYIPCVEMAHKYGFKTMAYVNICCACYQSPAWEKYKLSEFFLPQRVSIGYYQNKTLSQAEKDNVMNFKVFEGFKKGNLYYGDLLSPGWRKFHVQLMQQWRKETGTDANYEDTAGCGSDSGNGIVAGLSGAQGELEQMRMLQKAQPDVPSASEYCTASTAGTALWPLKLAYCWQFTDETRQSMIHDCRPVTAFVYGNRPWVGGNRSYNVFYRHVYTAMADAMGGFGFLGDHYFPWQTIEELDRSRSFEGHVLERTRLFTGKNLLPYFPEEDYPENILCMYKGSDGIYSYYDDGALQEMRGPDGKAVYGRIDNARAVRTGLHLENWPFQHDGRIFGLKNDRRYVLFRPERNRKAGAVTASSLPEGLFLHRYFETPEAVYLEVRSEQGASGSREFSFKTDPSIQYWQANDCPVDPRKFTAALPLRLIGFRSPRKTEGAGPAETWMISRTNAGCQLGLPEQLPAGRQSYEAPSYRKSNPALAVPLHVTDASAVLRFRFQDGGAPYMWQHEGVIFRLFVNGKEIRSFDSLKRPEIRKKQGPSAEERQTDHSWQQWDLPLREYAGKKILAVLEADSAKTDIGDKPVFAMPQLIR